MIKMLQWIERKFVMPIGNQKVVISKQRLEIRNQKSEMSR